MSNLLVETKVWDSLPEVVQNNIARQHREMGIQTINLPEAMYATMLALVNEQSAVDKIKAQLSTLQKQRLTAKRGELDALRRQEITLLGAYEAAVKERKDKRESLEPAKTATLLRKVVRASAWKRMFQVTSILGPLSAEGTTPQDDAEVDEHQLEISRKRKMAALQNL